MEGVKQREWVGLITRRGWKHLSGVESPSLHCRVTLPPTQASTFRIFASSAEHMITASIIGVCELVSHVNFYSHYRPLSLWQYCARRDMMVLILLITNLVLHRRWAVEWGRYLPVCEFILSVIIPYTEYLSDSAARIVAGRPVPRVASLLLFPGNPCKVFMPPLNES